MMTRSCGEQGLGNKKGSKSPGARGFLLAAEVVAQVPFSRSSSSSPPLDDACPKQQ